MSDIELGKRNGSSSSTSHEKKETGAVPENSLSTFDLCEGKQMSWRNVNMTLRQTKENEEKKLLDNVYGRVANRGVTAIMGPSGSGKTSLLNILAGRAKSNYLLKIDSDVRIDDRAVDPTSLKIRRRVAFVTQEDSLSVTSTPRECIRFSAKLRSPRSTTEEELDALVEKILRDLGLEKCADTMVGGALIKGISGGEKRRTSVGVELVVKPALVFLDEPTSGLDSFAAENLVRVLQGVAKAGSAVLCTIHQPSSTVYGLFNHLKEGGADSKEGGADSKRSAGL